MEPLTVTKIVLAVILVFVGVISAYLEIRKNPDYWLNRFFALFFTFASLGFFGYVLYHLILNSSDWVIYIMVTTNFLLNLCLACLLMTEFILEFSEKKAMSPKFLFITFSLFLSSIFGYFIWTPTVDSENYALGEVNTHTEPGLLIYISIYRLAIAFYVLIKFILLVKKAGDTRVRKQLRLFSIGMTFIIVGILLFLFGNVAGDIGIILEIIGQVSLNIGLIEILRGFLVKEK
ncbi:hypothetical protein [Candidatus Lokiarchaeum ossiferum]|uniref:hypothetical protein n=1 Tax=Candidatus Lokiarchaeum ossiferum TaxID=2951803 RepID=UPI00352CA46E